MAVPVPDTQPLDRYAGIVPRIFQWIAPLATRLALGQAFALGGWAKLTHLERTTASFTQLGIPLPAFNAVLVGLVEFIGGIALVIGFGTRIFALLLIITMVVAIATAHRQDFIDALAFVPGGKGVTGITAFVFLLLLSWLVAHGPGRLSLDQLIWWRARRGRALDRKAA